ncbi:hypothetical protein D3C78_1848450 [compost metagenome]
MLSKAAHSISQVRDYDSTEIRGRGASADVGSGKVDDLAGGDRFMKNQIRLVTVEDFTQPAGSEHAHAPSKA